MTKAILKWIGISGFLFGLLFFVMLYQEYRPVDESELFVERIRDKDLVCDFIYPLKRDKLPVLVFFGGSGGGFSNESELTSLALNGYAVLSLAYFKEKGLPDKLENIPLEYFGNAFDWLRTKLQVDTNRLFLLGVSRGAELALLLGSIYPQVKGVIAYSPSCFVFPNATEIKTDTLIASWTLKGNPVSFAPIKRFEEDSNIAINYKKYIDPLLQQKNFSEESIIRVEKINGPVLLVSGVRDLVWPASEMAKRIEERLIEKGFKHEFKNIIFADGGHDLVMFKDCYPIISSIAFKKIRLRIGGQAYQFNLGGTTFGVIESKVEARKIVLQFLDALKKHDR